MKTRNMLFADSIFVSSILTQASRIEIVSGEGSGPVTTAAFSGARTVRALRARLTRERCHGDRWARVVFDGQECGLL